MAEAESRDPSQREHPQVRLDEHDRRLTNLEKFKQQARGGLLVLSFLVGSGAVTALLFNLIF